MKVKVYEGCYGPRLGSDIPAKDLLQDLINALSEEDLEKLLITAVVDFHTGYTSDEEPCDSCFEWGSEYELDIEEYARRKLENKCDELG